MIVHFVDIGGIVDPHGFFSKVLFIIMYKLKKKCNENKDTTGLFIIAKTGRVSHSNKIRIKNHMDDKNNSINTSVKIQQNNKAWASRSATKSRDVQVILSCHIHSTRCQVLIPKC